MKKVFRVIGTITLSVFMLFFSVILVFRNNHNISDFGVETMNILNGIGIFFLGLVKVVFVILSIALTFLIPMFIYRIFRENENDFEFVKEWGSVILVVLFGISILSIAGVELRGLKEFDDKPTEVRIVEPNGKPKVNDLVPFYFNDSIGDWIEINEESFDEHRKMNHISKYFITSPEYYKKINGVWYPISRMVYNGYLKTGKRKVRKLTPIPKVEYLVWTVNKWESVTKDQFIEYRKSDSIVSFKQVYE